MDDLISRQAAIEELECVGYDFSESGLSNPELEELCEAIGEVEQDMIMRIRHLPSAQPTQSNTTQCVQSVGSVGDAISRQDAIDAQCKMRCGCVLSSCPLTFEEDGTEECTDVRLLMELPPAQRWIPVAEGLPKVKEQPYYEDEHQALRESKQILIWAKRPSTGKFGYAIGSLITDDGEEKGHQWNGIF